MSEPLVKEPGSKSEGIKYARGPLPDANTGGSSVTLR